MRVEIHPLSAERWRDLESLFGPKGAVGGCWCMWWRLSASEWERQKGEPNRKALRDLADQGAPTGLLAYVDGEPAGWCSVAPRADFPRLQRSRVLKAVDNQPVWSVVCFFIARKHRRAGIGTGLLLAAADFALEHGARVLEGYPLERREARMPDPSAYTGVSSMFLSAGFEEVERRSPARPIMRKKLQA